LSYRAIELFVEKQEAGKRSVGGLLLAVCKKRKVEGQTLVFSPLSAKRTGSRKDYFQENSWRKILKAL